MCYLVIFFFWFIYSSVVKKGYITAWHDDFEVEAILDHVEDEEEVSNGLCTQIYYRKAITFFIL